MKGDKLIKTQQFVMLFLIALFVGAYQCSTIHTKHHHLDEISECHVCHTSEQFDHTHHQSSIVIFNENMAVKNREEVDKIVVRPRFDYKDVPPCKKTDILETHQYDVQLISLGYQSTAPPYFYAT